MRRSAVMRLFCVLAPTLGLVQAVQAQSGGDPIAAALEATAPAAAPSPPAAPMPSATAPSPAVVDEEAAEMMAAPAPEPAPAAPPSSPPPPQISPPTAPAPGASAATPYSPLPSAGGQSYARPPQSYPAPPSAYARPGPATAKSQVFIHETGRTPDRPLSAYDMGYDARLRASSASAQGMQGPLDGNWTLNVPGVGDVYVLELIDRGVGPLEGAWRDLRRIGALGASGFIDQIERDGSTLIVRFSPSERGGAATATFTAQADGRWSGELAERGERNPAVLRRN